MTLWVTLLFLCLSHSKSVSTAETLSQSIRLRLYSDGISSEYDEVLIDGALKMLETSPKFYPEKPLVVSIHGMNMEAGSYFHKTVIDAFGASGKYISYNLVAVNYPRLAANSWENKYYFGVAQNAEIVGFRLRDFLIGMIKKGLADMKQTTLIGYSLGAHVAGYAARMLKNRVKCIIGLDPAGVGFETVLGLEALNADDADIVHMYHTNSHLFSTPLHKGTANFIFNGGMLQPGCLTGVLGCSHSRSVMLFYEAVVDSWAFEARSCYAIAAFSACLCNTRESKWLTFPPDESARGKYYVRTNAQSPFGMGTKGSTCAIWTP